jgi:hypothetical protein
MSDVTESDQSPSASPVGNLTANSTPPGMPFRDSMIPSDQVQEFLDSIEEPSEEMPGLLPTSPVWVEESLPGDLRKNLPSRPASKSISFLQDKAEYYFYMGHQGMSYDIYRQAWSRMRTSREPDEIKTLFLVAYIRSVADRNQLKGILDTDMGLQSAYQIITQTATAEVGGAVVAPLSIYIDSRDTFIRFLSIAEICQRINIPSKIPVLSFNKTLIDDLRMKMPNSTNQSNYLVWYYFQTFPQLYNMVQNIHSQHIENPVEWFLDSTPGHNLLQSCLKWLAKFIRITMNEQYRTDSESWQQEPLKKERALLKYEAALYRFLWKQWRLDNSSKDAYELNSIGITSPHFFKAVASLVVQQAQVFNDCSALWDAVNYLQFCDPDVLSSRLLNELSTVWSKQVNSDKLTLSLFEHAMQNNWRVHLDHDATAIEAAHESLGQDSNLEHGDSYLPKQERYIDMKRIRRLFGNPFRPDSGVAEGSGGLPLTAFQANSDPELSSILEMDNASVHGSKRNSTGTMASLQRNNSWNVSLRSSDVSFASFKAMKERLETNVGGSRFSQYSRRSFLSLLRRMFDEDGQEDIDINRLSTDFSRASLRSEDPDRRLSRASSTRTRNNVIVMDALDEDERIEVARVSEDGGDGILKEEGSDKAIEEEGESDKDTDEEIWGLI